MFVKMSTKQNSFVSSISEFVIVAFQVIYIVIRSCMANLLWFVDKNYKGIQDDVVLITGGGQGIGRQLAVEFAKHKPKQIILWGISEDRLAATATAVSLHRVPCQYMICDVSDRQQVVAKAKKVQELFGRVDILVNNAGIVFGNSFVDSVPEEVKKTVSVNTLGQIWMMKAFVPDMIDRNHGHIVSMNSMLGLMGLAGAADYAASKHALTGYMESLQVELVSEKKMGVHITSVHPYMVDTGMFAGCTTRFPWIFPELHKEYVATKILEAVLTNQPVLLLPRVMYLAVVAKSILPVEAVLLLYRYVGVDCSMDSFHGNKNKPITEKSD
ncbi:hypothetical protein NP493_991g00062 [Ridgeia piscesae]|uniref:Short-chain dehydrogenase/reductase 3 n=1 Tax=Ridgeia piscesae TaxID=27915 RepID=A0AAD9NKZ1_RIDPI|nr:hypothetical protein NP493_991g00062 [Ridgeia piscesae]